MILGMDETRLKQIARHVQKRVDAALLPGVAWCVKRHGEIVDKGLYGWRIPNAQILSEDCLYRLASMTKPVTACAVMIQCEKGFFRLTDPISEYFPEFADMRCYSEDGIVKAKPISILHLLTHSSGLLQEETGDAQLKSIEIKQGDTLSTIVPEYANTILAFQPGLRCNYSPLAALDVLARLVEVTSGKRYSQFLEEHIFEPLDMRDTTYHPTDEQFSRLVPLYIAEESGFVLRNTRSTYATLPDSYESGGAGLVGTLDDYVKFVEMLRLGGIGQNGSRLLCPRSVLRMRNSPFDPVIPGCGRGIAWGLGMRVILSDNSDAAPLSAGAYGWSGAYGTHFFIDPALDLTAVYMSNLANCGGASAPTTYEFENDVMQAVIEE